MKDTTLNEIKESFSFILPLVLFTAVFIIVPVIWAMFSSVFRDITFLDKKFIFLGNYKYLLADPGFWQALRFTFCFTLVSVPLEIAFGLVFALVLNEKIPFRGLLRACVLIPWAIPAAISARAWELIYNYNYGLANFLCMKLGVCDAPINWLGTNLGAFMS